MVDSDSRTHFGVKVLHFLTRTLFLFPDIKTVPLGNQKAAVRKRKETAPDKRHHQTYKKGLIENFRCRCHSFMERMNSLDNFFKKEKDVYMNRCTDITISTGFMHVSACLHHAWQQF